VALDPNTNTDHSRNPQLSFRRRHYPWLGRYLACNKQGNHQLLSSFVIAKYLNVYIHGEPIPESNRISISSISITSRLPASGDPNLTILPCHDCPIATSLPVCLFLHMPHSCLSNSHAQAHLNLARTISLPTHTAHTQYPGRTTLSLRLPLLSRASLRDSVIGSSPFLPLPPGIVGRALH
jgi:hypothetical protein